MKKYLLLYISLFFFVSPPSWSMDYDQEEGEYDQNDDAMLTQNNMTQNNMMMQQSNMMPQNGMMMNQGMMQMPTQMPMHNNMMMQRQGMLSPNGMMMNQNNFMPMQNNMMMQQPGMMMNQIEDPERREQEDESSKREYVQSLVHNILKVGNRRRNRVFQNEKGGTVIDRNLKNKLFKLQKDLNEISRSLDGISEVNDSSDEAESSKKSRSSAKTESSKKSKSSSKSKEKKSSVKSKATSKKTKSSKKSGSSKHKIYSKKRKHFYGRSKKLSKFNRPKSFYTVKQLTPRNAVKYVPKFYSSGYSEVRSNQQVVPAKAVSYKVKNWGTGEIIPVETYYYQNSQNSYFSNKSECESGCKAQ